MKVIIAGGRDFTNTAAMYEVLNELHDNQIITEDFTLVCGMARGADITAYHLCHEHGIPIEEYPANWTEYGKRAGYIRNEVMAGTADILIAFWDGTSKGTKHMIDTMNQQGKPVYVVNYT